MALPSLIHHNSEEEDIEKLSTQMYTSIQQDKNDFLSDKYHDIRTLMKKNNQEMEQLENISWQFEEFELSNRDTYNWYQIKQALKHDNPNFSQYDSIENANVFNPPCEEDESLQFSLPLGIEYWRRRQREISKSESNQEEIPYEIPKLRIKHRINAPPQVRK